MGVRAIDVSRHQYAINWHAVRDDGVRGAWIKVGGADGGYYRDSKAVANLNGAADAGLPFGTYYFCSPAPGDAVVQARHAVECGHGRGALWPAADVESNPAGLSREQMDRWVTDFCHEVARLTDRESLIYTYSGAGLVGYTPSAPRHCRLWIANYGGNTPSPHPPTWGTRHLPPAWAEWAVWQFNSTTSVPGIPDNTVDQNVVTDAFWHEMTSGGPPPKPRRDYTMNVVHCPEHTDNNHWFTVGGLRRVWIPDETVLAMLRKAYGCEVVTLTGGESWQYLWWHREIALTDVHWANENFMAQGVERNTAATTQIVNQALGNLSAPAIPDGFATEVAAAVLPGIGTAVFDAARAGAAAGVDAELDKISD